MGHEFWTENPRALVEKFCLFPKANSTLEDKMNAITRIVIIVFIILLVLKNKRAGIFLVVSIILVVILYYYLRDGRCNNKQKSERKESQGEERFMAHAGNGKLANDPSKTNFVEGDPGSNRRAHPRKPFPAAIPEDFVVRAPAGPSQTSSNREMNQNSDEKMNERAYYLQSLRARKAQLDEEEEIRALEEAIFSKATGRRETYKEEPVFEQEEVLASGTRHPLTSRFLAANDTIDDNRIPRTEPVRLGKSVAAKDRYSTSDGSERVDPFDLRMKKETRGYAQNQKFQQEMRRNIRNSNQ